jgi:hypothetical protein
MTIGGGEQRLGRRGGALDSKKQEAREMAAREAYIRSMDSGPFIYSCNEERRSDLRILVPLSTPVMGN